MIVTLALRIESLPNMYPEYFTTTGTPTECMAWLSGVLVDGVIVDSMKVMGE